MPLLDRAQVSPLPLPSQLSQLNPDSEVWLIDQTAEIFLDYESYANRYLFYSQPLFTPNLPSSDHQPMSFFQAINLEHQYLDRLIQSKFPTRLKSRLLSSIVEPSTQLMPNLDHLVDHLHRLYYNRFDVGEQVMVDLSFNQLPSSSSSIYYAKVVRVFPPKSIRDLNKNSYGDLIHLQAIDRFHLGLSDCLEIDDPKAYLYTIQLIDDDQSQSDNFNASYMEVETRKLSRHPDTFSKPLLKRFLQSVLLPYSSTQPFPRWILHPNISPQDSNPSTQPLPQIPVPSHKALIKHVNIPPTRLDRLEPDPKKRKKNKPSGPPLRTSVARAPPSYQDYLNNTTDPNSSVSSPPSIKLLNPKDPLTYRLEQLDPQLQISPSLVDCLPGNNDNDDDNNNNQKKKKKKKKKETLESFPSATPTPINSQPDHILASTLEMPNASEPSENLSTPTATLKELKKSIKYPIEDLDLDPLTIIDGRYLRRVNSTPLKLPKKPQFTRPHVARKFAQRLKIWSFANIFKLNERRCRFEEFDDSLNDLTARLVKLILSQSRLVYPTTRAKKFTSISVLPFFATHPAEECRVMSIDEREYWVRKGLRFVNISRRLQEFSRATTTHKKKSNRAVIEEDWVMGLMEIMCHRGGIERLGCMARILKYLLSIDATLLTIDHTCDQEESATDSIVRDPQSSQPAKAAQGQHDVQVNMDLEGDSPLTSNLDESITDDKSDLEGTNEMEDEEPENGIETGDEDGRRYGRSIRHQRHNPKLLKKTLKSRFEGLPVDDKLTVIDFLCDLASESEQVRNYMEECDERLTIVRKEKADVNKEKRKILEELSRLESRKADSAAKLPPKLSGEASTTNKDGEPSPMLGQLPSSVKPESSITDYPHAPSTELLEPSGVTSQNSIEPKEGIKYKLSQPKPPPLNLESNHNGTNSIDSACTKSLSPYSKPSIKKSEPPVKPLSSNHRPLLTPVRVATLSSRQIKQPLNTLSAENEIEREKQQLESQLFEIGLRELQLQERFRQLIGVTKLKPLGIDRFFCKYWWFEGIGGMEIHENETWKQENDFHRSQGGFEDEMKWYSGCIFVSGPGLEEWEKICESHGGSESVWKRRLREELGCSDRYHDNPITDDHYLNLKNQLIGVDDWGIYEDEDQIEELLNWLNSKGIRENNLKFNLKEWKEYIMTGIQNRNKFLVSRKMSNNRGLESSELLINQHHEDPVGAHEEQLHTKQDGMRAESSNIQRMSSNHVIKMEDGSLRSKNGSFSSSYPYSSDRLDRGGEKANLGSDDDDDNDDDNDDDDEHEEVEGEAEEQEEEEVDDLDHSSDELDSSNNDNQTNLDDQDYQLQDHPNHDADDDDDYDVD